MRRIKSMLMVLALVAYLAAALTFPSTANASPGLATQDLDSGLTPTDLVNALLGGGVSVSNITYTGANCAAGLFSGGSDIIGFESGVILSSGDIAGVVGPNDNDEWGERNGEPGDADLDGLIPGYTTQDAAVLEFDFIPSSSPIEFDYVFGSEEYNEYVNEDFNDVFGFFVNGENRALIPGTTTPVAINTINNGNPYDSDPRSHPELYRNNAVDDGGGSIDTQLDGLTVVLTVTAEVDVGASNHIKLAIADAGDDKVDSDVFIKAGSFKPADELPPIGEDTFYFAEGCTRDGFQEWLSLGNAGSSDVEVEVTYLFNDPALNTDRTYTAPANSRFTANVNAEVGPDKDVSIACSSDSLFLAERPMYFSYTGGGSSWTGGHDVVGPFATSTEWYFAEGYTGPGFDEWICVLNPGDNAADLTFRFQTQEEGPKTVGGLSCPARSRTSFKVNDLLEGKHFQTSLKLESDQPVVAERPMYFNYQGRGAWNWTGGHCVGGASSLANSYFLSEGTTRYEFEEWITLQNPNPAPITIDAVYQLGPGQGDPVHKSYEIGESRRFTVFVPDEVGAVKDVSVHLSSDDLFLAERPMYFDYQGTSAWGWTGGHCVIAATGESRDWFFAEGYTGPGFEEWLCLQNTGADEAKVRITYYPEGGGTPTVKDHAVPGASRYTVLVNADAGPGLAISTRITSDKPIVCERPMYFNYADGWTGGHDVVGFTPLLKE